MGMKRDTKAKSMSEVTLNIATGYLVGLALNIFILPNVPGVQLPVDLGELLLSAFYVSLIYSGVSWMRTYIFRRLFNTLSYNWTVWRAIKKI